jgi:prevent-host-death family protein
MAELRVSATDLRVHFKDLANQVARGDDTVVVSRHGFEMVVMVSLRDYQRIQKLKPSEPEEYLEHPDTMSIEEVERVYAATKDSTDPLTVTWREKAALSIWVRRDRFRATDPPS